jgi:hypothetical protein
MLLFLPLITLKNCLTYCSYRVRHLGGGWGGGTVQRTAYCFLPLLEEIWNLSHIGQHLIHYDLSIWKEIIKQYGHRNGAP